MVASKKAKPPEDIEEMHCIQRELATKVILEDNYKRPITSIAGIDLAFLDDIAFIACVTVDYTTLETKTVKTSTARLNFPYIPTLLFFREGPPIIDIIKYTEPKADIFIINAQGIAHPEFLGCASHVGVLANVPTVGVTSRRLCGDYEREPGEVGEAVPMRCGGRKVGWVVKSKAGNRPVFVSPGHRISLESSLEIVMKCVKNHKLPEPLHLAHLEANRERRKHLRS